MALRSSFIPSLCGFRFGYRAQRLGFGGPTTVARTAGRRGEFPQLSYMYNFHTPGTVE